MTKTRSIRFSRRRRGGRKTVKRRGGRRRSRVTKRGGKRRSRVTKRRGGRRRSRRRRGGDATTTKPPAKTCSRRTNCDGCTNPGEKRNCIWNCGAGSCPEVAYNKEHLTTTIPWPTTTTRAK